MYKACVYIRNSLTYLHRSSWHIQLWKKWRALFRSVTSCCFSAYFIYLAGEHPPRAAEGQITLDTTHGSVLSPDVSLTVSVCWPDAGQIRSESTRPSYACPAARDVHRESCRDSVPRHLDVMTWAPEREQTEEERHHMHTRKMLSLRMNAKIDSKAAVVLTSDEKWRSTPNISSSPEQISDHTHREHSSTYKQKNNTPCHIIII